MLFRFDVVSSSSPCLPRLTRAERDRGAPDDATTGPSSEPAMESDEKKWEFSLYANTYLISGGQDFVQPTFSADHDWLHLEARYNYEGIDTGSAWVGYDFSVGDKVKLDFTPMIGGVFGQHLRRRAGLRNHPFVVEAGALQRRRIRVRHGRFIE